MIVDMRIYNIVPRKTLSYLICSRRSDCRSCNAMSVTLSAISWSSTDRCTR